MTDLNLTPSAPTDLSLNGAAVGATGPSGPAGATGAAGAAGATGAAGSDGITAPLWIGTRYISGGADDTGVTDIVATVFAPGSLIDPIVIPDYDAMIAAGYTLYIQLYGYIEPNCLISAEDSGSNTPITIIDSTSYTIDRYRTSETWLVPGWPAQGTDDLTVILKRWLGSAGTHDFFSTSYVFRWRWNYDGNDAGPYGLLTGAEFADTFAIGAYRVRDSFLYSPLTGTVTLGLDSDVESADATGGNVTVNLLPVATNELGARRYTIIKTDVSANTVTIEPDGAETISGDPNFVLTAQWESVTFTCDGTQWLVIDHYVP